MKALFNFLILTYLFGGVTTVASPFEENFHSSLYIDDPRVNQIEGHLKLLDGFSRRLFKQSNSCFDLEGFKGTLQSNISLNVEQKVQGTIIYNPFFSQYFNNIYNSHVDAILKKQDQKVSSAVQVVLHKTTFMRERDTDYVSLQDRYKQLITTGDFFSFGELCASGYVNSVDKYAGAWFNIVFNRDADGNDTSFVNLLETYIRLFDSSLEPKIRAELNRELANRRAVLYAEFRGLNPLTIPIQNLRDIEQFRKLLIQIKSAMLSSDAGLNMAMEYTPWGYNDEFQNAFFEYLKRNSKLPIPTEPDRRQWFNFYRNIEVARMMGDASQYETSIVDRFDVCRRQMLRDYPLNRQNPNQLFVNHLDPDGTGVPLSQIHQILSEEALKNLQTKLDELINGAENSIALCSKKLTGSLFLSNPYRDLKECAWFDNYSKTSSLVLDALCPLTPK